MKTIIHNPNNLKDTDITEIVTRAKALIIKDENILLGNSNKIYQFLGGHKEEGESIKDCLKREILEESGIKIENKEIEGPFYKVIFLSKDWPEKGKNRKAEIYYYIVKTNKNINLSKTKYTQHEKENNFKIETIKLTEVIKKIKENIPNNEQNKIISPDMITIIEEYLSKISN